MSQHNEEEMVILAWPDPYSRPAGAWPPRAAPAWGPPLPASSTSSQSAGRLRSAHPGGYPAAGWACSKASAGLPTVNLILIAPPRKVPAPRTVHSQVGSVKAFLPCK